MCALSTRSPQQRLDTLAAANRGRVAKLLPEKCRRMRDLTAEPRADRPALTVAGAEASWRGVM
jgi:hypothetical protein